MLFDPSARSYTSAEADEILSSIYKCYFNRPVDRSGRETFAAIISKYGFKGIAFVIYQMLQSKEMDNRVASELAQIYWQYLGREPDPVGRQTHDFQLRFFRDAGRIEVTDIIKNSAEYLKRASALRDLESSVNDVLRQINITPNRPDLYTRLADIYDSLYQIEDAIDAVSHAVLLEQAAALYYRRGTLYARVDKHESAIEDFRLALEKGFAPQDEAYIGIGKSLEQLGELADAAEAYRRATVVAGSSRIQAWYRLALVQEQLKQPDKVIESCTKAIELSPLGDLAADVFYQRAKAFLMRGESERAASDFSQFVGQSAGRKRLIQGSSPTIYLVSNSKKHGIPDPPTMYYLALENSLRFIERVSALELNAYPESHPLESILSCRLVQGPSSGDPSVYLVEKGRRRWIPNPDTFYALGLDASRIEVLPNEDLLSIPLAPPIRNVLGKQPLQRGASSGTYFLLERGKRRQMPNVETLDALGYLPEEVQEAPDSQLDAIELGYPVPNLASIRATDQ